MGTIETTYDPANDLTLVKASGRMTAEDHRAWVVQYYTRGRVTSHILWDVTEADYTAISTQDVKEHVAFTKELAGDRRKGGKTAVVVDENMLGRGLSRMRESFFEMEDVPVAMQTFTRMDEALQWLAL